MQIFDLFNNYNKNMTYENAKETVQLQGSTSSAASGRAVLQVGTVFEGTISGQKDGVVTICLANGESLTAKLYDGVSLQQGQSVFFEVKGMNENNQIMIRPYVGEGINNPTISAALSAAGLSISARNIEMVETMMSSQLSIDRNSLQSMVKTLASFPEAKVDTIVTMTKLSIPVTAENIALFENYNTDKHAILNEMTHMMEEIPKLLASEHDSAGQGVKLAGEIFAVLSEGLSEGEVGSLGDFLTETEAYMAEDHPGQNVVMNPQTNEQNDVQQNAQTSEQHPIQQNAQPVNRGEQSAQAPLLTGEEYAHLSKTLQTMAQTSEPIAGLLTKDGQLSPEVTPKQLLMALAEALQEPESVEVKQLHQLFGQSGFSKLLATVMEKQWLLQPQQVASQDKIKELYERLDRQMEKFEQAFSRANTPQTAHLAKGAADIRSNISFMNHINQTYAYVQIPLKMSNQNAHSDLYVFSNKRNSASREGELSAFLHLDMKHLGSTDVYITMKDEKVGTNFYLEDETAFELIMQHIDRLTERIRSRGYQCTIKVENRAGKVDFVEDFLKEGQSVGSLHRYSFDVTA